MESGNRRTTSVIAACLILIACFSASGPHRANAADPETEAARFLGKNLADSFSSEYGVITDPLLVQWVRRIAAKLTPLSPRQNLAYHFTILDTAEVNAFTLPGGYVFVTRGLLDFASSRDEVAGVIGHEIGHVYHRDPMHIIEWQLASSLALRYGPFPHGSLATAAEQAGAFLATLQFSRQDESRADQFGIRVAYEAGYDPEGLPQFLRDLGGKQHPTFLERYLATHPPNVDRIHALDRTPYMRPDNWKLQQQVGEQLLTSCRPSLAAGHFWEALAAHPGDAVLEAGIKEATATCGGAEDPSSDSLHPAGAPSSPVPGVPNHTSNTEADRVPGSAVSDAIPGSVIAQSAAPSREDASAALSSVEKEISRPVREVRRSLAGLRGLQALNVNLQDALLAASTTRLDDIRWLALAYQAYGEVNRVDDVFSGLARVDYRMETGVNAMQIEMAAAHPTGTRSGEVWEGAIRFANETRSAAQNMARAARRLDAGAGLISAVLADLDTALLGFHHQVSNLRFAAVEAALIAADKEISEGRRLASRAVDSLALAEDRVLLLQLDRMGSEANSRRLTVFDCNAADILGTDSAEIQTIREAGTPYGDAIVQSALSIELGKPLSAVQSRFSQFETFSSSTKGGPAPVSWVDAVSEQGGSPALMEIMLRQVAQAVHEESSCG